MPAKKKNKLKVPKGKMGNFTFTVHLGGIGATAEEAWADVQEAIAMDGLGCIPDLCYIRLDDVTDMD